MLCMYTEMNVPYYSNFNYFVTKGRYGIHFYVLVNVLVLNDCYNTIYQYYVTKNEKCMLTFY